MSRNFRLKSTNVLRACLFAALAMAASLALAAAAQAGAITGNSTAYTFNAVSGEANSVVVTVASPTSIEIVDNGATLTENSAYCTKSGNVVTCTIKSSGATNFTWNLGDQDDYVDLAAPVNDTIDGGLGADILNCGDGQDTISYTSRTAGVRVTPDDGVANDGELTEFDWLDTGCEASKGGSGPDVLYMANNATKAEVDGGNGNDYIIGGPANASTSCSSSDNPTKLLGGTGNDTVVNSVGGAYLQGYDGNDLLVGGRDCDYIFSGDGSDTVYAGDGGSYVWDLWGSSGQSNMFFGGPGSDSFVTSWQGTNTVVVADEVGDDYTCYSTATDTVIANSWDTHETSQGDGDATCDTLIKN